MFKLIIQDDEGKTTVVPMIRDEITIGRKEGNTIRLTERNVSRRHARLLRSNGSIVIEDLDSYNGIRVNGTRIQGRVQVAETDRIQIGDYLLELKLDRVGQNGGGANGAIGEDQRTQPIERIEGAPPPPAAAAAAGTPTTQLKQTLPPDAAPVPLPGDGDPTLRHEGRGGGAAGADPSLPPPLPGAAGSAAPHTDLPAKLVCLSSNFAGREFSLDRPAMVIGRTDDNDVVVNHRSISRHHAKIVREHGRYAIVDLQSSNGVRVNGEEYGKVELRRGDLIDLGHVRLRFVEAGEDFVFSRDATVVDLAAEAGKKSRMPLFVLGGVVVAAGVAALLIFGGGDDKGGSKAGGSDKNPAVNPPNARTDAGAAVVAVTADAAAEDPVGPGPASADVNRKLAEARQAIAAEDWSRALAAANQALTLEPDNEEAKALAEKARAENDALGAFEEFRKEAKAKRVEGAAAAFQKIPEDSVYKSRAAQELDKLSERWLNEQLGLAKRAADTGKCDQITPIRKKVTDSFPDRTDVLDKLEGEAGRCTAGRPKDKPPKDPPKDPPPKDPPPKDPPAVFDEAKWETLKEEAKDAYLKGQYASAMRKADEALKMRYDERTAVTGGLSACKLKDGEKAKKYAAKLPVGKKNQLKQVCTDAGVDFE